MKKRNDIKQALAILMLSPIYFKMSLAARRELLREYCQLYQSAEES